MIFLLPHQKRIFAALAVITFVASVGSLLACQVPVFRYALERWTTDRYELEVIPASGGLSGDEKTSLEFLEKSLESNDVPINLRVRVNEEVGNATNKAVAKLFYPGRKRPAIWQGGLTMKNARRLIDSPIRRQLATRILKGESSIWVLVECEDAAKNDEAARVLEEKLKLAKSSLDLPEGVIGRNETPSPDSGPVDQENILQSDVPLKIDFSILRLSRKDQKESIFLTMFLNLETDLIDLSSDPMVFPVFGRGRALEPLVGRGITEGNILEYSGYLCGACSCEVKDQNPGMDLLMAVNWDAAIEGSEVIIEKVLPPLEGTAALIDIAPSENKTVKETVPQADPDAIEEGITESEGGSQYRSWGITVGLVILLIVIVSRFLVRKSS